LKNIVFSLHLSGFLNFRKTIKITETLTLKYYQMKKANYFMHYLVIISVLFLSNSLLAGNSRAVHNGSNSESSSNSEKFPSTWNDSLNIKWKTVIHDKGWSAPVVSGDQIWVTTSTDDGKKMYAVCINAKSGAIVHDVLVLENETTKWKNGMNTYATPTPVVEDGFVYVEFGHYGTACIDANSGKIVWKRTDVSTENIPHGAASSPIIYKNLLIINHEGNVILQITALDKKTGATVWQVFRPEECFTGVQADWRKSHSTPIIINVNGKDQLISCGSQVCQAFDPETGKEIWRVFYGGHDSTVSSPIYWNGIVYINTGLNIQDGKQLAEMWAVRPDGIGDVTNTNVLWKCKDDVPGISTPVIKDGLIFMVSERGTVSCLDAKTGELIWKEKITGNFNGSPACIGNKVYFTNFNGLTTVINADKIFQVVAENQLIGKYIARPTAYGNSLIIRSDTQLYRIED
jgi:outer membrane protein assembly factor BamB